MDDRTPSARKQGQWKLDDKVRARRHWILAGLGALAVLLVAEVLILRQPAKPPPPPSVPVNVAKAAAADIPISITALGAAQAWTSVTVLAQVTGKLLNVNFTEGTDVQKGQLLAQIDPAPYLAALTQAQGTLKRDQALLANARIDLERYVALDAANAISKQTVDTQRALVQQDEGTVKTDEGVVAAAQVNLGWCSIVSPVDGRVGVRLVDPGNLVSASGSVSNTPSTAAATNVSGITGNSGSGIVTINQIEPIAVTFTVPEGDFQRLAALSDGFRKPLKTQALSQETGQMLDAGVLAVADNRVDPATGTVQMKARFENGQLKLWPGQFINVRLTLQTLQHVVTIPSAGVNEGPNGSFAYVVGANRKVKAQPISVQVTQDQTAVVQKGLQSGDTVVVDGQVSLSPGATVSIRGAAGAGKRGQQKS